MRIRDFLMKFNRRISKLLRNPSYDIELVSEIKIREHIKFEDIRDALYSKLSDKKCVLRGLQICFTEQKSNCDIDVKIVSHLNKQVSSLTIRTRSVVRYRNLRKIIDEMLFIISNLENIVDKELGSFSITRTLVLETKHLKKISEILDSLRIMRIRGLIKGSYDEFTYYNNEILIITGRITKETISWIHGLISCI